jgi:hypothetical protein
MEDCSDFSDVFCSSSDDKPLYLKSEKEEHEENLEKTHQ